MTARRSLLLRSTALLVLCALAAPAVAWNFDCRYGADRRITVDTAGATRLFVHALAGDLEVVPVAGATAIARGRACTSHERQLEEIQVQARREGDVVHVYVRLPEPARGFFGNQYARLDLTVEVPTELEVEIEDSSGDLEARDLRIVRVTDSSGDIALRNVRSDVEINDSSGDILVSDAAGRVTLTDSSGDVRITGAQAVHVLSDSSGDLVIERITGDVNVERDSSGDIRVRDVGGDVRVGSDSSGSIRVTDVRGKVDLPRDR
jgi:DUF4097 and DUF4098 domain-containing protein YvlB